MPQNMPVNTKTALSSSQSSSQTNSNPIAYFINFIKGLKLDKTNTKSKTNNISNFENKHHKDVETAWLGLEKNYSRLHTALYDLEATEGDVIEFAHLAEALDLTQDLVQNYFDTVCFTCIDERGQKNSHSALSIGIPGTFCLEKKSCGLFAKKIVLDCKAAGVSKIKLMPHAKCGAATLAVEAEFKELGWDTNNIPDILIDKKAIDYAESMATSIVKAAQNMDYSLDVKVEFIGIQEIYPSTFHYAVGSMVSVSDSQSLDLAKPHLDPKLFNEYIDPMFNISGFGEDETIVDRLILSVDIAFGGHGMGTQIFTKENPYLVLMITDSKEAITRAKECLLPLFKARIEQKYADYLVESYVLDLSNLKKISDLGLAQA